MSQLDELDEVLTCDIDLQLLLDLVEVLGKEVALLDLGEILEYLAFIDVLDLLLCQCTDVSSLSMAIE